MDDIERALDSILDRYRKKQEERRDRESREQDEYHALENEFKNLFHTVVQPSMTKMVNYLESKGNEFKGSFVKVSAQLAKISLIINPYKLRQGSKWTEIEFLRDGDKLKINKTENNVSTEALFEKSELNAHFVKKILIDFVKSYYKREQSV
jgi:hypothetical protein